MEFTDTYMQKSTLYIAHFGGYITHFGGYTTHFGDTYFQLPIHIRPYANTPARLSNKYAGNNVIESKTTMTCLFFDLTDAFIFNLD